MILAGLVEVDGRRVDKAGTRDRRRRARSASPARSIPTSRAAASSSRRRSTPSASTPPGLVCLDVGASTGGFTDCLLQRGAARVYAIDVGYGQLDAKLRDDPRVVLREKVNARYLSGRARPRARRARRDGPLVHLRAARAAGRRAAAVAPGARSSSSSSRSSRRGDARSAREGSCATRASESGSSGRFWITASRSVCRESESSRRRFAARRGIRSTSRPSPPSDRRHESLQAAPRKF